MQRAEKIIKIAALQKKIQRQKTIIRHIEEDALQQLYANPKSGWVMSDTIARVIDYCQRQGLIKSGSFIDVYSPSHLNNAKQIFANIIANKEVVIRRKVKSKPYVFALMPNNNHFVVVAIDEKGYAVIYNELMTYDDATKNMLIELGFNKSKIKFHPHKGELKYTQIDSFSCGDRGFRNIFRLLGIDDPIVNAEYTSDLRKNTIRLISETLIYTNEKWKESKGKIAQYEKEIRDLENSKVADNSPQISPSSLSGSTNEIINIIDDLNTHVERIQKMKDYKEGFWVFSGSRALSREVNLLLALELIKDLTKLNERYMQANTDAEKKAILKETDKLFNHANLIVVRNAIKDSDKNRFANASNDIYSFNLNRVFKDARKSLHDALLKPNASVQLKK